MLSFSFGKAQELTPSYFKTEDVSHQINLKFDGYYNSTNLSNDFTSLFYKGGHIDSTLKNSISENLFDENRIGAELNYGITYKNYHSHLLGKPQLGWFVSIEDIGNYHANFSKNAFDLVFYGNSRFAGDTIQITPVEAELLRYQKLTIGGFNKNNNSYVGISFLKGQSYNQLQINNSDLYTAPSAESLSGNIQASYIQSDTTSDNNLSAFNGWGLSTDLVFYLNMGKNKNIKFQNAFCLSIQNLGFIQWKNITTSVIDTQFVFNGFQVNDLFDSTSYNFSDRLEDSLDIKKYNRTYTKLIPAIFTFSKAIDPNSEEKFQGIYGVRVRTHSFYKPLFFVGLYYRANEKINMSTFLSVGGYGRFKVGLQFSYAPFKNFSFHLASGNLVGYSKSGYGKDLTLRLGYAF